MDFEESESNLLPIGFANTVGLGSRWAFPGIPCHRLAAVGMEVQRAGAEPGGGKNTDAPGGGGVAVDRVTRETTQNPDHL